METNVVKQVSPTQVVALLNELLEFDRECVSRLVFARVPCNMDIASHPTVQVTEGHHVGMFGFLNGLFGVDEKGYGAIKYHYDDNDPETIIGFSLNEPWASHDNT